MRRFLLVAAALCTVPNLWAQNKTYDLYVVAEGNFGTPNGDVFKVSRTDSVTVTTSAGLYQTANALPGIDVLQDFGIFGNKAVFCGKGGASNPVRLAITGYPDFDTLKTFTGAGIQCLGKASNTKAYISMATGSTMQQIDLTNNTLIPVTDPGAHIGSNTSYMTAANGFVYAAMGSKIVKIDTITNATTGAILPGIGTIAGMEYDSTNNCIWLLGRVSGVSALMKMEPFNSDFLNPAIILTGVTNAGYLRLAANKLYFLSGKNVHAYNIASPNIPTTSLYTSTLSGNSFSFAYGKSFYADPVTGDFAMATAGNYAEPSRYEIVDGNTLQMIDSGHVDGRIANELILRTYSRPTPDNTTLPVIYAACETTVTAPTATAGNAVITATTADSVHYDDQGNYTITWTYNNGYSSTTQTQQVIIEDTLAPVADVSMLPALQVNCPYTLLPPTATDNCAGILNGTTDSLQFTTAGTHNITWTYNDGHGNISSQLQALTVTCSTGIAHTAASQVSLAVYPNPSMGLVHIIAESPAAVKGASIVIYNILGQQVWQENIRTARHKTAVHGVLLPGVYYIFTTKGGKPNSTVKKLIVQ